MKRKLICILVLSLSAFVFSGCWDKVEIDQRAFVFAMAVDKAMDKGDFKVTFFMPIPSKISGNGDVKAFSFETATGKSIPECITNLSQKFDRSPYFGQIKVVMIGSELAGDSKMLREIIDFIERYPDMGREMNIAVVKGEANLTSKVEPKYDKILAAYIMGVFRNSGQISKLLSINCSSFLSSIRNSDGRALIPVITPMQNKIKIDTLGMVDGYRLMGIVPENMINGTSILTGKLNKGKIYVNYKNISIPFDVTSFERKIYIDGYRQRLNFIYSIKLEGSVYEYTEDGRITDKNNIDNVKKIIEGYIKDETYKAADFYKNSIRKDYIGLKDFTEKFCPEVYGLKEANWDSAFSNAKFTVNAEVFIRRTGAEK